MSEAEIMDRLSRLVHAPATRSFLLGMAEALRHQLGEEPEAVSTQAPVPLEVYGSPLPGGIASSWVFVLRERQVHPAERHPNSTQRMFALDSPGAMEVWEQGDWRSRPLAPGGAEGGLSIPVQAWHRPALIDHMWAVVSFHTVPAKALVEETGDPARNQVAGSRAYITQ